MRPVATDGFDVSGGEGRRMPASLTPGPSPIWERGDASCDHADRKRSWYSLRLATNQLSWIGHHHSLSSASPG